MSFWLQRNLSVGETLITSPPLTSFKVRFAIANFYCNLLTCILTRVNLSQQSESSKLTRVSQSSISQRDFQSYASFWFSQTLTQPFNSSSQIFMGFNSFFFRLFSDPDSISASIFRPTALAPSPPPPRPTPSASLDACGRRRRLTWSPTPPPFGAVAEKKKKKEEKERQRKRRRTRKRERTEERESRKKERKKG